MYFIDPSAAQTVNYNFDPNDKYVDANLAYTSYCDDLDVELTPPGDLATLMSSNTFSAWASQDITTPSAHFMTISTTDTALAGAYTGRRV